MRGLTIIFLSFCHFVTSGQISPTPSQEVSEALEQKALMTQTALVKNIRFKNVGPSVMSGRVVDVDVNPENPTEFYVGYASGGLWYTNNNGTSFIPVMDSAATQNVGDIAVDWISGTIWVGTGENNASRSSYAGIGLLKSTDKGKTWQSMGLTDSHHIGRILINPKNPDEVVVGVTGHLYSKNVQRGIFKTVDGGKSWQKLLFIDDETGIIDLVHVPENFNIQYAAAWKKDRKAWNFTGNGESSGIYKSTDGGNTWAKVTNAESGFPIGKGIGRIGLAVFDENTIYAVHDNQFRREKAKGQKRKPDKLYKDDFRSMSPAYFLKLDDQKLNDFLKTNNFHEKYRAENIKQLVRSGSVKPIDLATYLEDANALLFDTPVVGAEVYRSADGGKTWTKQNENYIDDLYYSYGYYFAQIRVDPKDRNKIYLGGVPLLKSEDGGNTFVSISNKNVHADHHALWINPELPGHLINGNDGGVNISYDDGAHWTKNNSPTVGQFYAINVDNQEPYHIYGGLQDNGVWKGPYNSEENSLWHQTGQYPWESILGGDGMQVQIDNRNPNVVYTGYQFGNYYRLDLEKNSKVGIMPKHELGASMYRFNWQTPILLSPHNQDIIYMGSNQLHRSMNQGNDWEAISEDLTHGGRKGNVAYGTLTSISESAFAFGLLYTGSDDGLIHVSKNGGGSWEEIGTNIDLSSFKNLTGLGKGPGLWVSRVAASQHKKERVYASLNGYRWDDFTPYVFVSDDYGKTWKSISNGIPTSSVNVILEDPVNEDLLFVGTDNGLYISLDRGESWEAFQSGMPHVAVHDLVIQKQARHLLVGTHGRSIYQADISHLQQLRPEVLEKDLYLFEVEPIVHSTDWGNSPGAWSKPSTPGLDLVFFSSDSATFLATIQTLDGILINSVNIEAGRGLSILSYDVAFSKLGKSAYLRKNKKSLPEAENGKTYLPVGEYTIQLEGNGNKEKISFEVKPGSSIK